MSEFLHRIIMVNGKRNMKALNKIIGNKKNYYFSYKIQFFRLQ